MLDSVEEGEVRSLHLSARSIINWSDECGVAVNFHHERDILVALLIMEGEAASFI